MESLLKIMGGALGILVPALFIYALNIGISKTSLPYGKKINYKTLSFILVGSWTVLIWILSLNGVLSYRTGDSFPRFLIALFVPVIIGVSLLFNKSFRTLIDSIPVSVLVGVQTFRLAGFAFLIVVNMSILPGAFSSGGYGDILTGSFAIFTGLMLSRNDKKANILFWLFNVVGLLDLLNVAFLLLYYYPIWNHSAITSAAAFDFSLIMIPAIAAPVALLLHFYSLRNYLLKKKAQ